jgi:hypothetical protein
VGAVEVVDGEGCSGHEGARRWGRVLAGIMAVTTRLMGQRMGDESVLASLSSSQYGCGRGWIMATAIGPPQASEHVHGLAGVVRALDAEVGLQGRTEATARHALWHCSGRVWACVVWPMPCSCEKGPCCMMIREVRGVYWTW